MSCRPMEDLEREASPIAAGMANDDIISKNGDGNISGAGLTCASLFSEAGASTLCFDCISSFRGLGGDSASSSTRLLRKDESIAFGLAVLESVGGSSASSARPEVP